MTLREHLQRQIEAALGPENRWYCSEFFGREITDPDLLLEYFIKHGGADFFGQPAMMRTGGPTPQHTCLQ